jgi:glutaredoxin 3
MIEIHSKSDCPYCTMAKAYFQKNDIPYLETVHDNYDDRQSLYDQLELVDHRTVPQIFLVQGGMREYIGGYSDLLKADLISRLQVENFDADF